MAPVWNPDEANSGLYQEVEKHSDGMISFTYHRPTPEDLDALKDTQTFQNLIRERDTNSKNA